MALYYHNGSGWVLINSTSSLSGPNLYTRTSSGTGSVNETRILNVSYHNGSGWNQVYQAYVPTPAPAPSTPTGLAVSTSWDSRIDQTTIKWNKNTTAPAGYTLTWTVLEPSGSLYDTGSQDYANTASGTGTFYMLPEGYLYKFKLYAYNVNELGQRTYSGYQWVLNIRSGKTAQPFTLTSPAQYLNRGGNTCTNARSSFSLSKTGNGSDLYVKGYCEVTSVTYNLNPSPYGLTSTTRRIDFSGTGVPSMSYVHPNYGLTTSSDSYAAYPSAFGGGTYTITASGTASGNGWTSTTSSCTPGTVYANISGFRISGYETKGNETSTVYE